jgi:small-conductance mechanosensitive channel
MRSPRSARLALGFLFLAALTIGLTATLAPHTFYDDFPFLAHWVELLPPYNEHLVTDVGGLYLGFAVLLAWAAWTLERTLVVAVSVAWLLSAAIHLLFHAGHLAHFGTTDAIAEIASLALLLIPPPIAVWATETRSSFQPHSD